MYGFDHGWLFGGWIVMALFWIIPIVLFIAALKYLFSSPPRSNSSGGRKTALDMLDDAYARGEISREEFLQKREDLKK